MKNIAKVFFLRKKIRQSIKAPSKKIDQKLYAEDHSRNVFIEIPKKQEKSIQPILPEVEKVKQEEVKQEEVKTKEHTRSPIKKSFENVVSIPNVKITNINYHKEKGSFLVDLSDIRSNHKIKKNKEKNIIDGQYIKKITNASEKKSVSEKTIEGKSKAILEIPSSQIRSVSTKTKKENFLPLIFPKDQIKSVTHQVKKEEPIKDQDIHFLEIHTSQIKSISPIYIKKKDMLKPVIDEESNTTIELHESHDEKNQESIATIELESHDGKNQESNTTIELESHDGKNQESNATIELESYSGQNQESNSLPL